MMHDGENIYSTCDHSFYLHDTAQTFTFANNKTHCSRSSDTAASVVGRRNRFGLTDYFGQLLSPQWNTGKFSADSAEPSTQDPLGLFAVEKG